MKVYDMRDLPEQADQIRDPFQWERFRGWRFMLPGIMIALLVIIGSGREPAADARGQGLRAGQAVTATAVDLATRVSTGASAR